MNGMNLLEKRKKNKLKILTTVGELLIKLYNVKSGSLYSIAQSCGYKHPAGCYLFAIKPILLSKGILREKEKGFYVVDHTELDRLFLAEEKTNILWDRAIKYVVKPKKKEE